MNYYNDMQKIVVEAKIKDGYELFGETRSDLNGLQAFMVVKGKHTMVINSLGYDEHYPGRNWRIY